MKPRFLCVLLPMLIVISRWQDNAGECAMVHALVPSDRVEAAAVYGRDGEKIGTIERLMLEKKAGTVADSGVSHL